jgi:predicted RNase H-like HicB family nuclease
MFNYPATLTKDGGTFLVTFRDVPEAITFGTDKKEALLNAVDALETGLSFYVDSRKPLPLPSKAKRDYCLANCAGVCKIRRVPSNDRTRHQEVRII